MNRTTIRFCAIAAAISAATVVSAQEESAAGEANAGEQAVAGLASKPAPRHFHTLVRLLSVDGEASVRLPRAGEFKEAVAGKFYPGGSTFRVEGGSAELEFGKDVVLKAETGAEFTIADFDVGARERVVIPVKGSFSVSLPRTMPTGLFSVAYPDFTVKDLAGESHHKLELLGDGNESVIHVVTGLLAVDGHHYKIARMGAADRIRIRTTGEKLFTSLRGEAGDCKVTLDQGISSYKDPISGEVKTQQRSIEFALTPQHAVKIFRKRSEVGGRMAVSVMTFDAAGEMRNRFTYAEGAANINWGEEVVRIQDVSFKTDVKRAKGAKHAAKEGGEANAEAGASEGGGQSSEETSGGESSGESSQSQDSGGFGAF